MCECLIDDAKLTLVDDDGNENKHGTQLHGLEDLF